MLIQMHDGVCGGHYSAKTTAGKIVWAGYYWPTLFKDAHEHVKKCDPCQRFSSKLKYVLLLIKLQLVFIVKVILYILVG